MSRRRLAAGHVLGHPLPEAVEVHLLEEPLAALLDHRPLEAVEHAVVHHLVAGAGTAEGAAGLGDVADAAAHLLGLPDDVVAGHRGRALRRGEQRGEHPQRRGLAGAVGAEEPDDLTLGHVEVDAVDGAHLGLLLALPGLEGLHETPCTDHPGSSLFKLEY
jgi:hypothetical protein